MKPLRWLTLASILLLGPSAVAALPEQTASHAPGRFIVKFKREGAHALSGVSTSIEQLNAFHHVRAARHRFVTHHGLSALQARARRQPGPDPLPDLTNVYVLDLPPEADVEEVCRAYRADPHVEYAQPDYRVEAQWVPNDPYYSANSSWGQPYDDLWGLKKIQADLAWDLTKGGGIVVAVVDSGLDATHPDIAANVWTNPGEVANNGVDDDGNGYVDDVKGWDFVNGDNTPQDGDGHGTHVAGTIAAVGNNGVGILGVAPEARIMPLKGLDDWGSGWISDLAEAIVYAAENGAAVINNSWGCGSPCPSNPIAEDAVRTAYGLGAVVVFAAGNSSDDVADYSPQNMTDAKPVVVAASTQADTPAFFTNVGTLIDVAAPGGGTTSPPPSYAPYCNILSLKSSTCNAAMCPSSLIVGASYLRQAGTSMAAPHASGVAALILARQPSLTNEEVRGLLRSSADDIGSVGFDPSTGDGRINAWRAVSNAGAPNQPPLLTPIGSKTVAEGQLLSFTIVASDPDGNPLTYSVEALPSGATLTGQTFSWTPGFDQAGSYVVTFSVSDGDLTDEEAVTITVTNVSLKVSSLSDSPDPFSPNGDGTRETTKFSGKFNHEATSWQLDIKDAAGSLVQSFVGSGRLLTQVWDGKNASGILVPDGVYTYLLSGVDVGGSSASKSNKVTVDTVAPVVSGVDDAPDPFSPSTGQTTTIAFTLSETSVVTLKLYNAAGSLVRTLLSNKTLTTLTNTSVWDGKDRYGTVVSPGTYTYKLWAEDKAKNKASPYPLLGTVTVQ